MSEIDEKKVGVVAGLEGGQAVSALPDDEAEVKIGERDGRHWALHKATAPQLSVLAAMATEYATADCKLENPAEFLEFCVIDGVASVYGEELMKRYRHIFRSPGCLYSKPYLHGFVRAAADAWRECIEPITTG